MAARHERTQAHSYTARVVWTGNTGDGTGSYASYSRDHVVRIAGKPDLAGSADAAFRGEAGRHNPEDLFVASIAACHMLVYLGVCARHGVRVLSYEDEATGTLTLDRSGQGRFEEVVLRPVVGIAEGSDAEVAIELHEQAHVRCFIASSCSVPIRHEPSVQTPEHFR
jgi:organic hydroperoxide reductase OsmC/OhrA